MRCMFGRVVDIFFADDERDFAKTEAEEKEREGGAGAGAQPSRKSDDDALKKCGKCKKKLMLTQQLIKCACGLAFCDAHRASWEHSCAFDFKAKGKEQLSNTLERGRSVPATPEKYLELYNSDHTGRRMRMFHSAAFLATIGYFAAAVVYWFVAFRHSLLMYLWRVLIFSAFIGIVVARLGCAVDGCYKHGSPFAPTRCRLCMWSLGLSWSPSLAWLCEVETLKENVAFMLSNRKRNCLTRELYSGTRTCHGMLQCVSNHVTGAEDEQ